MSPAQKKLIDRTITAIAYLAFVPSVMFIIMIFVLSSRGHPVETVIQEQWLEPAIPLAVGVGLLWVRSFMRADSETT